MRTGHEAAGTMRALNDKEAGSVPVAADAGSKLNVRVPFNVLVHVAIHGVGTMDECICQHLQGIMAKSSLISSYTTW